MADYQFTCPKCGQTMMIQEEWIGKEVMCAYCKEAVTVSAEAVCPMATQPVGGQAPAASSQTLQPPSMQNAAFGIGGAQCQSADTERIWRAGLDFDKITKWLKNTFIGFFVAYGAGLLITIIGVVVLSILGVIVVQTDGNEVLGVITVLASVVFCLLMVLSGVSICFCGYGHHYYVWQLLPPWKMPAGPLATVLLLLVPFYNAYWGFKSIADQGVLLEQELGPQAHGTCMAAKAFAICIACCYANIILSLLGLIPIVGFLFSFAGMLINLATVVANIIWFILVHKSALQLLEKRRQEAAIA